MSEITIPTSAAMEAFGRWLGSQLQAGDVVVLTGPLGAGKTTLTRGLGEGLGVVSPVQSPTFIVAREHERRESRAPRLVHIDAYRLGSVAELEDLDIDWPGSIAVIEWGRPYIEGVVGQWLDIEITPTAEAGEEPDSSGEEDVPRRIILTAHADSGLTNTRLRNLAEAASDFSY